MQLSNGAKISPFAHAFLPQEKNKVKTEEPAIRKDSIMISQEARARLIGSVREDRSASMIENLLEQRQKVQDAKSELIGETLEAGEDLETIKVQLEVFDEQMAEIDGQLSMIEMQKREQLQREREERVKESIPKQENADTVQMTSMLKASQSLDQVDALKQVRVPIENAHRRLKTELENDGGPGVFVEGKAQEIQNLAGRIQKIDGEMMNQIGKARKASEGMNQEIYVEEQEEESVNKVSQGK